MRSSTPVCDRRFNQMWISAKRRALRKQIGSGQHDPWKQLCPVVLQVAAKYPIYSVQQLPCNSNEAYQVSTRTGSMNPSSRRIKINGQGSAFISRSPSSMDIAARFACGAAPKKAKAARRSGYPYHTTKRSSSALAAESNHRGFASDGEGLSRDAPALIAAVPGSRSACQKK